MSNPQLISDIAERFGSQCMVVSIQAKRVGENRWEAYVECGREKTGLDVEEWAKEAEKRGAGEILVTSIDSDGTCKGGDVELVRRVAGAASIPVIASGGVGSVQDATTLIDQGLADALAVGKALHSDRLGINDLKQAVS